MLKDYIVNKLKKNNFAKKIMEIKQNESWKKCNKIYDTNEKSEKNKRIKWKANEKNIKLD